MKRYTVKKGHVKFRAGVVLHLSLRQALKRNWGLVAHDPGGDFDGVRPRDLPKEMLGKGAIEGGERGPFRVEMRRDITLQFVSFKRGEEVCLEKKLSKSERDAFGLSEEEDAKRLAKIQAKEQAKVDAKKKTQAVARAKTKAEAEAEAEAAEEAKAAAKKKAADEAMAKGKDPDDSGEGPADPADKADPTTPPGGDAETAGEAGASSDSEVEQTPEEVEAKKLLDAVKSLWEGMADDSFTGDGELKVSAVSQACGFKVSRADVEGALDALGIRADDEGDEAKD